MAKKQETENELGGLPPELMVDGQELPASQIETVEEDPTVPDTDKQENQGEVIVVVLKGQTVKHNSKEYKEFVQLTLSKEDADRLIELGVVADVNKLRQQALIQHGPTVTVSDGVKISHEA
ncbi:hypothetical protein BB987_09115 [Photorhabdus temperata]|uniref:Uncharacterized protein n=1 Tax=Photorhabdus khanii NC19 TaxID=1004151 RepID=W3V7R5_9GAMM|nr:hypothetical protein [Photorhabdus khanii]ETS31059.1 hypothetical protein PTE_03010 [Photorhabdus khanii NC19]OHV54869.1 hypothetical protein BB987_09115 [Photorhabdus temperata]